MFLKTYQFRLLIVQTKPYLQDDLRNDGRSKQDYRPIELELDIVTHANGSARVRLANTDILVGVKTEIDVPKLERPAEGKIEFFVDWSVFVLMVL